MLWKTWIEKKIVRDLGVVHFSTSKLVIQVIHAISVHHARDKVQGEERELTYLRFWSCCGKRDCGVVLKGKVGRSRSTDVFCLERHVRVAPTNEIRRRIDVLT